MTCHLKIYDLFVPDRKLCVKARLTGALQVTMNLVKNNTAFFKVLQPALQILKLYSANCEYLYSLLKVAEHSFHGLCLIHHYF